MRRKWGFLLVGLAVWGLACGASVPAADVPTLAPTREVVSLAPDDKSVLVGVYDPTRDPAQDVQAAVSLARSENKRILLEVGGEWCGWCYTMDAFLEDHPDLLELRDQNYVLVKVNFSSENENGAFLSQYPDIPGYPHIFVLDSDGTLLHSQDTAELEEGDSYNLGKFTAFLQEWSP